MKLDGDTLPTVPAAPPAAGPDRALDPVAPDRGPLTGLLPAVGWPADDAGCAADTEGDAVRPTESPTTRQTTTAATIHTRFLFASTRRSVGRRACLVVVVCADKCGSDPGGGGGGGRRPSGVTGTSTIGRAWRGVGLGVTGEGFLGVCRVVIVHDGAPLAHVAI